MSTSIRLTACLITSAFVTSADADSHLSQTPAERRNDPPDRPAGNPVTAKLSRAIRKDATAGISASAAIDHAAVAVKTIGSN
jgi:hypothetical protein